MKTWPIALACLALLTQPSRADDRVDGVWVGRYMCGQGETGLTLTIGSLMGGAIQAQFLFYPTQKNTGVPVGCFAMAGTFDPTHRDIQLTAGHWILHPDGYVTVDLKGHLTGKGSDLQGTVAGPGCSTFNLHRINADPKHGTQSCRPPNIAMSMEIQP